MLWRDQSIYQSKYGHVFVFGNLNGEDHEPSAPLSGSATESLNKYMQVLHAFFLSVFISFKNLQRRFRLRVDDFVTLQAV